MSNTKIEKAVERLNTEIKNITVGNSTESRAIAAMKDAVKDQLIAFCTQSAEFAEKIADSDKTFGDCMKAVADKVQYSLSDYEAYKRAVQFYFPDADIECSMKIKTAKPNNVIAVNFMDLLGK